MAMDFISNFYQYLNKLRNFFAPHRVDNYCPKTWGRMLMLWMMGAHAFYFVLRCSFQMAMPLMLKQLPFSPMELGYIVTGWSIFYGLGKFVNIYLNRFFSPRRLLTLGLFLSALANLAFSFMYENLSSLICIWSIAGLTQSIGWPQCVRLMGYWYKQQELGTKWGILSTTNQIGSFLLFVTFWLIPVSNWQYFFILPAIVSIITSAAIAFSPLITPHKYKGFRDEFKGDKNKRLSHNSGHISLKEFYTEILKNNNIWLIAIANLFLYMVKTSLNIWLPTYLAYRACISTSLVGLNMAIFEIGAALGSISAGIISDRIFKGSRSQVAMLYMLILLLILPVLYLCNLVNSGVGLFGILFILGFSLFGPQIMTGTASLDFSSYRLSVAANSFVGFMASFGSAISGPLFGFIVQNYGWDYTLILLIFGILMVILLFYLLKYKNNKSLS